MSDPRRRCPPERALRWVTESLGAGSRIVSLRRLTAGGWHANHALTVVDRSGRAQRLVLRRWARPEWIVDDPNLTPAREAAVLELLADSPVRAPRVVAADPHGAACDVPALLIRRLPGRPPGLPSHMDDFLAQLAQTLAGDPRRWGAGAWPDPRLSQLRRPPPLGSAAVVPAAGAVGAGARARRRRAAAGAVRPDPPRLPPREHALVARAADRRHRLDDRLVGRARSMPPTRVGTWRSATASTRPIASCTCTGRSPAERPTTSPTGMPSPSSISYPTWIPATGRASIWTGSSATSRAHCHE